MSLVHIIEQFPTEESCFAHLELVRWGDDPQCPHCGSEDVARKRERGRRGRWNCHHCKSSFNVLSGTVMEKTRIPIRTWFFAIELLVNAKKSLSSYQLARDLSLTQKTAWYLAMRLRKAMEIHDQLLYGIVEADETYIGGKPRWGQRSKRGRGTKKTPVAGAVERGGGNVVAQVTPNVTKKELSTFLR